MVRRCLGERDWGGEEQDLQNGLEMLVEVQPVPVAGQARLDSATGTGCTKRQGMHAVGKLFVTQAEPWASHHLTRALNLQDSLDVFLYKKVTLSSFKLAL